jgi:microbial collagenase
VAISAPGRATRNHAVVFAARASDPQGRIVGYRWAFGDGKGGWRAQPKHAFGAIGTFTVTLKVIDSWGNWAYTARPIGIVAGTKRRNGHG